MSSDLLDLKSLRIECDESLIDPCRLHDFIRNFCHRIKKLYWHFCDVEIDPNEVAETFKSISNLKVVSIYNMKLKESFLDEDSVSEISLPELRSLSCYSSVVNVQKLILKFTSKKLKRFTNFSKECGTSLNVKRFFKKNKNLQTVALYGCYSNLYSIRHLKQLTHLYIDELQCIDSSKIFGAICKLKELIHLDVSITAVSPSFLSSMKNLTSLKYLVLRSNDNSCECSEKFEVISSVCIPNLQTIHINIGNVSTDKEALEKLSSNCAELESFEMSFSENRDVFDFIESFSKLEKMTLNFTLDSHTCDNFSAYFAGMQNIIDESKLRSLNLHFVNFIEANQEDCDKTLVKIINLIPSLTDLSIVGIKFSLDAVLLKNMLNVWHQIEDLDLSFFSADCRNFRHELGNLKSLIEPLCEFSISLDISMQCLIHLEQFKSDIRELEINDMITIGMAYDANYFKVKLAKVEQ